jgi:predicted transcriptional regulator of viral defense system
MKWIEIDKQLAQAGFKMFTYREFQRITGIGPVASKFLLIRYTRRGLLARLKRGLYAAKSRLPGSWTIANRLYTPSYVSLASALSYYGLIPETVYSATSVTTKATRAFGAEGISYSYRTIKRSSFAGYRSIEIQGEPVLIAEKERALADYLYFVFLKKESLNSRLSLRKINRRKLTEYLKMFTHPGLMEWFKHDFKAPDRRTAR